MPRTVAYDLDGKENYVIEYLIPVINKGEPGNSGSPMFDRNGQLVRLLSVGILTLILQEFILQRH